MFWFSRMTDLKHWIFFSCLDVFLMFLVKSEVMFPISGIKQAHWWHVRLKAKLKLNRKFSPGQIFVVLRSFLNIISLQGS